MKCPKNCPNKYCKALYDEKTRESTMFDFCKPQKGERKMNVFEPRKEYSPAGWRWLVNAAIQHHNLMELAELTRIIFKEA